MKVKEYIQWLLPSRKWRVLAIIITGVIVGGGALFLYMLRAHTYLAGLCQLSHHGTLLCNLVP